MSEISNISIDLTKIPKEKIKSVVKKDGTMAKYLDITVFTRDEPDQYGNTASLSISLSKEERAAKTPAIYLGNGKKTYDSKAPVVNEAPAVNQMGVTDDDLPF
jgi:hypothetical protein